MSSFIYLFLLFIDKDNGKVFGSYSELSSSLVTKHILDSWKDARQGIRDQFRIRLSLSACCTIWITNHVFGTVT